MPSEKWGPFDLGLNVLAHCWHNMAYNFQKTSSNTVPYLKNVLFKFGVNFTWFLKAWLMKIQDDLRQCIGSQHTTSHYLNIFGPIHWDICASRSLYDLRQICPKSIVRLISCNIQEKNKESSSAIRDDFCSAAVHLLALIHKFVFHVIPNPSFNAF